MRIVEPTASPTGKSASATVRPSTATLVAARTSASVKKSPADTFHERMNGKSTSTPWICVAQLSSPATTCAEVRAVAET